MPRVKPLGDLLRISAVGAAPTANDTPQINAITSVANHRSNALYRGTIYKAVSYSCPFSVLQASRATIRSYASLQRWSAIAVHDFANANSPLALAAGRLLFEI